MLFLCCGDLARTSTKLLSHALLSALKSCALRSDEWRRREEGGRERCVSSSKDKVRMSKCHFGLEVVSRAIETIALF